MMYLFKVASCPPPDLILGQKIVIALERLDVDRACTDAALEAFMDHIIPNQDEMAYWTQVIDTARAQDTPVLDHIGPLLHALGDEPSIRKWISLREAFDQPDLLTNSTTAKESVARINNAATGMYHLGCTLIADWLTTDRVHSYTQHLVLVVDQLERGHEFLHESLTNFLTLARSKELSQIDWGTTADHSALSQGASTPSQRSVSPPVPHQRSVSPPVPHTDYSQPPIRMSLTTGDLVAERAAVETLSGSINAKIIAQNCTLTTQWITFITDLDTLFYGIEDVGPLDPSSIPIPISDTAGTTVEKSNAMLDDTCHWALTYLRYRCVDGYKLIAPDIFQKDWATVYLTNFREWSLAIHALGIKVPDYKIDLTALDADITNNQIDDLALCHTILDIQQIWLDWIQVTTCVVNVVPFRCGAEPIADSTRPSPPQTPPPLYVSGYNSDAPDGQHPPGSPSLSVRSAPHSDAPNELTPTKNTDLPLKAKSKLCKIL